MLDIYLINLRHNTDRLNYFLDNIPICFSNVKIFDAINGNDCKIPEWFRIKNNLKGRYGCYQSHLKILKKIDKTTLILEDDCLFSPHFCRKYSEILDILPNLDYDMMYLGGHHRIKPCGISNIKKCTSTILTHSYIIKNKNSADKIINLITNQFTWEHYLNNTNYEIDLLYSKLQADNLINSYCVDPWIVYQNQKFVSNTKN